MLESYMYKTVLQYNGNSNFCHFKRAVIEKSVQDKQY